MITFSRKIGLGSRDVLDRLPRHGFGQEADEVAGMPRLEGDADLAVGLEAADARPVSGARIDDDKGTAAFGSISTPLGGTMRTRA